MSFQVDEALSSAQAAAMIGVRPTTLEIWRCKGKGPSFRKLGSAKQAAVIYARSEVERWLTERTFNSTSAYSAKAA